jgi:hypothetical protein
MSDKTYVTIFAEGTVCTHKSFLTVPLLPFLVMLNPRSPLFFPTWSILTVIFLVNWLILPCNPNLNCSSGGKDGIKALWVSAILAYLILFSIAIVAKLLLCSTNAQGPNMSVTDNLGTLFRGRS